MRLTIKSVIRWEQLRGKSFSLLDYSNKDDVETLLYTTAICSEGHLVCTFDVFRHMLSNKKIVRKMLSALEHEMAVMNQFRNQEVCSGGKDEVSGTIGELVSTPIVSGFDAHYILNEMELCDLPMYIRSYEAKKKELMENSRLWTFLSMLPHIDAKKMKNGAKDLVRFPWEEDEEKQEAERDINDNFERFEKFMNTKKSDYNGG